MRHLIATSGGQIHLREYGPADADVVVLLHETPTDSRAFHPVATELSSNLRVIAVDTPGNGASDPLPPGPASGERYADVIGQALDGIGIESASLVGVHTGAVLAVHLAAGPWAGRVDHLVLTGVPIYRDDERREKGAVRHQAPEPVEDGEHLMELWRRLSAMVGPLDHRTRLACQILLAAEPYRAYEAVFGEDLRMLLAGLAIPTLLLNCDDDPLCRRDDEVVALLRDATIRRVGGQRPIYHTQPGAYAEAIRSFVSAAGAGF